MDGMYPTLIRYCQCISGCSAREKRYFELIAKTFSDVNLRFDLNVPLHVEMQRIFMQFSHLVMKDGVIKPNYEQNVASICSVAVYSNMMRPLLGTWLGRYAKAFLHLSVHLNAVGRTVGFRDYTLEDVLSARSHLARVLLADLERLLKPGKLESLGNKLQVLRALFLVLVVAIIAMRYRATEDRTETRPEIKATETKDDALERLLWHYLVHIGNLSSLLKSEVDAKDAVSQVTFFTPAKSIQQFRAVHERPSEVPETLYHPSDAIIKDNCFFCRPIIGSFQLTNNSDDLRSAQCCPNCQRVLKEFDAQHSRRKKKPSEGKTQSENSSSRSDQSSDWFSGELTTQPFDLRSGNLDSRFVDESGSLLPLSEERPEELGWATFRLCCMHHLNGGDVDDPCYHDDLEAFGTGHVLFNPGFVYSEEDWG
ncbi:hypothetical protein BDV96DRAFT_602046 [Lophiotrema nucula]|uniref:Uncharacterized protein n=1 Tax=Lophiotrema nucula TaxID=690887 RepID=A0A6A5Z2P2_9PLEO|nr:hypothetical protein BDV96DRAFT_602046 [Lophiotrema nucula]